LTYYIYLDYFLQLLMIAFELFWFKIYWYWIFYLLAFLLWYLFLWFVAKKKFFKNYINLQNLLEHWIDDLVIAVAIWVLLWWRLWYVFIYDFKYFLQNPLEIFAIWQWWMSFVWWVLWVIFWIYIIKKLFKLSWNEFLLLMDLIVLVLPIWIMLGRIWNYLNQELFGRKFESAVKMFPILWNDILEWFLKKFDIVRIYKNFDNNYRINTNFLESFFEWFLLFIWLFIVFIKKYISLVFIPWLISWLFLLFYWVFRFFLEFLRYHPYTDYYSIFTKTQFIMLFFIVWWIILVSRKRNF